MPTQKAKFEKKIDIDQLLEAIKSVKIHGNSRLSVAKSTGIPETTLRRYIGKIEKANVDVSTAGDDALKNILTDLTTLGAKPILNIQQEKELVQYLLRVSKLYYGLSIKEFRSLAYEYAKKISAKYPPSWDEKGEASKDFYYAFMNRHRNLSLRTPEQISQQRAKSFNKENVGMFFANLSTVMETPFLPTRIWNMDETGLPTVPTRTIKVISRRGARNVGQKTSQERGTTVSVAVAVSASGVCIPPMYLFPRANMKQVFMTHAAPGAVGYANGSGWMTAEYFVKFMHHFITHSGAKKGSPTLLLIDNHTSHLSIETIELAVEHDIIMLSFPPHCTHKLQPLDVSVFAPFKTAVTEQHSAWQKSNVSLTFDLHHIPLIAEQALDIAATPKNIKSGFRATGISPLNINIFSDSDYLASDLSGENFFGDEDDDPEQQRRTFVLTEDDIELSTGAHEEVSTSADTSMPSTSGLASTSSLAGSTSSLRDALKAVGPVHLKTPAKKSNRGRKPMKSSILTSPENVAATRAKHDAKLNTPAGKKKAPSKKKTPAKKGKKSAEPAPKKAKPNEVEEDVDRDFCILCLKPMPTVLNRNNSRECDTCGRKVHARCVHTVTSYFTCPNCDSN